MLNHVHVCVRHKVGLPITFRLVDVSYALLGLPGPTTACMLVYGGKWKLNKDK